MTDLAATTREQSGLGQLIKSEHKGEITTITIDRPAKLNALSGALMTQLSHALTAAESDDDTKVVVLTGAPSAFSVGYDISEEVASGLARPEDWHRQLSSNVALTMQVWSLSKPVVGAVDGWCLAGGCELAMACDILIAADTAQFGEPEIRFGSGPVTLLMPFILGQKRTNELLFTGDVIDATTAERLGLINRVVPAPELLATAEQLARKIALTPLPVLRLTKLALNRAYEAMGLRNAVSANLDLAAVLNAAHSKEHSEFGELVATQGLRSALAWRDARYAPFEQA
ncbi:MAG TPA: enoyl-CoA hydratase/isomerase family protein [Actinomycetes bacterium]|nr:enoyl-CoA hydratase/isomerase family protein [Actinomycetes bacterium]